MLVLGVGGGGGFVTLPATNMETQKGRYKRLQFP